MKTGSDLSINAQELSRLLELQDVRELGRLIGLRPSIFRWFASAEVCDYFVEKNIHDTNLRHGWSQPLKISNQPGHIIVSAIVKGQARWRHANPAFMFPLKWTQSPHSEKVPCALVEVAKQVSERLRASPRLIEQSQSADAMARLQADWGLSWSLSDWQDVNLSALPLSPESAWAPLTLGLASAIVGTHLSDDLLATGFWDSEKNVWTVGPATLPAKLSTGFQAGRQLFVVPASVAQDARSFLRLHDQKKAMVVELVDDPDDLYAGVLPGLLQSGTEPTSAEPLQQQIDWYLSRATNNESDDYYYKVLLPAIAVIRRNELAGTEISNWRPGYLLSIVSNSEVLIPLTSLIFRPRKLQLIYTHDTPQSRGMEERFNKFESWLTEIKKIHPELSEVELLRPLVVDDALESLPKFVDCLKRIPRDAGKPSVLIDSTPGKRAMQLAMLQGAQQGDRILCWWHNTHLANRRPIPFSEKMLLWEVTAENMLRPLTVSQSHTGNTESKK